MENSEKDQALLAVIDAAASNAYNSDTSDQLASDRARSIERYLGRNFDPAPAGRSQVRDRSVFETVEWIKPSLLRIFCSSNEVAKFEAVGPEDEPLAEQESDYINYVVTQRNPWYQIANDWFSDGLLLKNGYTIAWWDKTVQTESEQYENLTDEGLTLLLQDKTIEVVEHTERPNEERDQQQYQQYQMAMQQYQQMAQQMVMQAQQQGIQPQLPPQPQPPQPSYLHDVTIRRVNEKGQVKIAVIPPEHCRISVNTSNYTLDDCDYFEWFDEQTIGQLRAAGFKIPDDIATQDDDDDTLEDNARNLYNEDQESDDGNQGSDPTLRRVTVRYVWIRHDYNKDGINEMQYVVVIGKTVIYREECTDIPVASISPIPLAHRHIGMSVADSVADIEDVNTAFTRQAIDNLFYSNNPRLAVSDRVNMSDLLDSRPGGIIRVDGQPPQEVMPVVVPDMFPQAVNALQFFDSRRMNRTGINAYFQGTDANVLNKTASGISQLTSSAAQRVEMIARLFSFGILRLFLIVHRLYLQHGHAQETIKLKNQWIKIDPSQWKTRSDVRLTVGLGTGNKDQQLAHLNAIIEKQATLGIPTNTATPENIYHSLSEFAKAASFTNPELFFSDPKNVQPKPQPEDPMVQAAKIKAQTDMQTNQADIQHKHTTEQVNKQFEMWKAERELEFNKWKAELDANVKIAIAQMTASVQVDLADKQIQGNKEVKVMDAVSQSHMSEMDRNHEDMMTQQADAKAKQTTDSIANELSKLHSTIEGKKAVGVEKVRDPKTGKMVAAKIKRADGTSDEVTIQ